ncbi:TPA: hypothetical protein UM674_001609 [Stenotrophomonas maltophilia]|nr:hypothetical protein [Stenotrophomonas maltophilia]
MGYELWTSPVTGYRRHGTRLNDFNDVLGCRAMVSDICEPLKCCPAGAPADEMRVELERLDFTVAGVKDLESGPVIGFVERDSLTHGEVRDHLCALSMAAAIPNTTNVVCLLQQLQRSPFVFVENDSVVDAILTWADINKPIVRIYIFGLISLLEMHLSFWVASTYRDDQWKAVLRDRRVLAAVAVQEGRRRFGQELPLIQCLQLCDKRDLVLQSEALRQLFGLNSKNSGEKFFKNVEALRNSLAHSQYDIVVGGAWGEMLSLIARIQAAVQLSDLHVENGAMQSSARFSSLLW